MKLMGMKRRKALMTRRWRLSAVAVMAVVALLAALLPATAAEAANGFPRNFFANVRNLYTQTCMNVRGNSTDAGAWIQEYGCDGTGASDFLFWTVGDDGVYEILGEHSNLCVTPSGSSVHDGTQLVQWYCVGAATQQWKLVPVGGGVYEIYNPATNLCLTEPDRNWTTILQIKGCNSTALQVWLPDNVLAV